VSVQGGRWAPVPGQQLVEAARWIPAGHALKHGGEIGEGFDVVELGGGDEGADRCPALGTTIGSGEQMVFTAQRDRPDRALERDRNFGNALLCREPYTTEPVELNDLLIR
jgi:hypothetical protein